MGMSTGGGGRRAMAEINVTPFVDVMLVLLIIFMVATPMIEKKDDDKNREVDINLPVTKDNPNVVNLEDTEKFILQIDDKLIVRAGEEVLSDCSAKLEGTDPQRFEPCFVQLENALSTNTKLQDEGTLYLLADINIPYGFVVGAMSRIKKAGINNVGMVTNPEYLPKK